MAGYNVLQYIFKAFNIRKRHSTSSEASCIVTLSGSCVVRKGDNGDCAAGVIPSESQQQICINYISSILLKKKILPFHKSSPLRFEVLLLEDPLPLRLE